MILSYPQNYNSIDLDSQGTLTETPKKLSLSLSPVHQIMEGGKGEDRSLLSFGIGMLPADLPNLMSDRQGWANLNMILTMVD